MHTAHNPSEAVKDELAKVDEIKKMIGDDLDEKLILDTIEGETNLSELLLEIEDGIAEREVMIEVLEKRIADLSVRKSRMVNTRNTLRTIILSAMDSAGIKTIVGPLATLTVKSTGSPLEVSDEKLIPSEYFTPQDPKLNKKAITDDLKNGKTIPGANLGEKGIVLQIIRA